MKLYKKIENKIFEFTKDDIDNIEKFMIENDGKLIEIKYTVVKSKRSAAANRYYWGALISAWNRLYPDYTKNAIHKVLGEELRVVPKTVEEMDLEKKIKERNEDFTEIDPFKIKGSSEMNSNEFYEYCKRATLLLHEMGGHLEYFEKTEYDNIIEMYGDKNGK